MFSETTLNKDIMCDPALKHGMQISWRTFMQSLCQTKRVRAASDNATGKDSTNDKRSCFPCELARLGVANGNCLAAGVFLEVGYVAGNVVTW